MNNEQINCEKNPFYVGELLSPINQPMADVETLDTPEKTNALLGFLVS